MQITVYRCPDDECELGTVLIKLNICYKILVKFLTCIKDNLIILSLVFEIFPYNRNTHISIKKHTMFSNPK